MYVDVLKVQLAASEVDIFYQMINQLLTRSSIMKKKKYITSIARGLTQMLSYALNMMYLNMKKNTECR